jgi:hypothetical protein
MPDNRKPIEGFENLLAYMRRMSSCSGRQGYDSKGMAERIAVRSRKRGNGKVAVYRCGECGQWHIGNSNRGQR